MIRKSLTLMLAVMLVLSATVIPPTGSMGSPTSLMVAEAQASGYYVPITITEQSGNDLHNYSVKIVLNSTNFDGWDNILYDNGSDIYFTDSDGNPLYYWIKYFNKTAQEATIWVKVPYIPASGTVTIYMYYGSTNPYVSYKDPSKVFLIYETDWNDLSTNWNAVAITTSATWSVDTATTINGPTLKSHGGQGEAILYRLGLNVTNVAIELDMMPSAGSGINCQPTFGIRYISSDGTWLEFRINAYIGGTSYGASIVEKSSTDNVIWRTSAFAVSAYAVYHVRIYAYNSEVRMEVYDNNGNLLADSGWVTTSVTHGGFLGPMFVGDNNDMWWDNLIVRYYVDPKPKVVIGCSAVVGISGYRVPITITERSGSDLYNYSVKITLNSTNFSWWGHIASANGGDVYFTDADGNPLYYWIESFNKTAQEAIIWVKVPYIPANGTATIYMYYGSTNPYTTYNDPKKVFLFYDDFNDGIIDPMWNLDIPAGKITESDGYLVFDSNGQDTDWWEGTIEYAPIAYVNISSSNFCVEAELSQIDVVTDDRWGTGVFVAGNPLRDNVYMLRKVGKSELNPTHQVDLDKIVNDVGTANVVTSGADVPTPIVFKITKYGNTLRFYYNDELLYELNGEFTIYYAGLTNCDWYSGFDLKSYFDWFLIRAFTNPEPVFAVGSEEILGGLLLPSSSVLIEHAVVYSPNSTQFAHTFTAGNATYAGYEVGFADQYGWRVYAEPYDEGGVLHENNASLVSEVSITLPYSDVLVDNVTLWARANGTGSYRRLWIKIFDAGDNVVAEVGNATIGTDWTKIVISVNASTSIVKLWINATVVTTTADPEEIDIRDVKVSARYNASVPTYLRIPLQPNVKFYKCVGKFNVGLGSATYLNRSVILIKLIHYLVYNGTDYPIQPVHVGNETIDGEMYEVFRIDPANYSQELAVHALLENKIQDIPTYVGNYQANTVLVGETLTVLLPTPANLTIKELNLSFSNVTSVSIKFNSTGTYTFVANVTKIRQWMVGYATKAVRVKYGSFSVELLDIRSRLVDYENMTVLLVNKTIYEIEEEENGEKEIEWNYNLAGKAVGTAGMFSFGGLAYGNYTVVAKVGDLTVCIAGFEMNITNDNATLTLECNMMSLPKDYRGFNRSVALSLGTEFVDVKNLSDKYPFSRVEVVVKGNGSFTLYIDYRGKLPTKVRVEGNVTDLMYHWDGNYLVISGSLGSVGVVNVTDLYEVEVRAYDRLGNLLPSWFYLAINGTEYKGSIVRDYYYPSTYVISVPKEINGFAFYAFEGNTTIPKKVVEVNASDVALKVYYRVPTKVETVKTYQVTSAWEPVLRFFRWVRSAFTTQQEGGNDTVVVYVEGYLLDYYGNGVPNRAVVINITNENTGYVRSLNATTDASGYFRSSEVVLAKGMPYKVEVYFDGDDIYVGTVKTSEFKTGTLPSAPVQVAFPINYALVAVGIAIVVAGIFMAFRSVRHAVVGIREATRRFVVRKRFVRRKQK